MKTKNVMRKNTPIWFLTTLALSMSPLMMLLRFVAALGLLSPSVARSFTISANDFSGPVSLSSSCGLSLSCDLLPSFSFFESAGFWALESWLLLSWSLLLSRSLLVELAPPLVPASPLASAPPLVPALPFAVLLCCPSSGAGSSYPAMAAFSRASSCLSCCLLSLCGVIFFLLF